MENIVIGKPIYSLIELMPDWTMNNTFFTEERFLPEVLRQAGITTQSNSWFRKNKPEYFTELNDLDCIWVKLGKKKKPIYIIIGE